MESDLEVVLSGIPEEVDSAIKWGVFLTHSTGVAGAMERTKSSRKQPIRQCAKMAD
jgi:hypothetical protein